MLLITTQATTPSLVKTNLKAKLDSEINVRFLNENGDLYFLHNNRVHIILLNLKKKIKNKKKLPEGTKI